MNRQKIQRLTVSILLAATFAFSTMSHAEEAGVGVTGYKWLQMTEKNQRAYVEGALDAFVYAFGVTDDNGLAWSLKYININMQWDLFMKLIKKHFEENSGQVHNVMVAAIKDALENGVPDPQEQEYEDEDRAFIDDLDLVMDDK